MNRIASHKIAWTTFVANIIIFMFHANLKNYFTDMTGTFADYVMDFFSALAIPMMTYFFFISAFLYFRNFDMSKLKGKLKTRINSIIIPYVIWNTFSVILQLIKGTPILEGGWISFIRNNYIFVNGSGCANGPLWYLFRLLEFVALSPIIYYVVRNKKLLVTSLICSAVIALNLMVGIGYFGFLYFLPVYIAGAYVGANYSQNFENWINTNSNKIDWLKLIFCFGVIVLFGYTVVFSESVLLRITLRYISICPILYAMHLSADREPCAFITNGGGMYLYCFHDIVYRIVRNIISNLSGNMFEHWVALVLLSGAIMIAIYCILYKFMRGFLAILTGGR